MVSGKQAYVQLYGGVERLSLKTLLPSVKLPSELRLSFCEGEG